MPSKNKPGCNCCQEPQSQTYFCLGCSGGIEFYVAYTVDFGAATLTDDPCDWCDQIAGTYLIEHTGSQCQWTFTGALTCESADDDTIDLLMTFNPFTGVLRLEILIDNAIAGTRLSAVYNSASVASDCSQSPITFNRASFSTSYCTGTLPASITLTAA